MNILEKFLYWKENPKRAPITFRNIWAVIQSLFRRNINLPAHIEEQVEQLRKPNTSAECLKEGACLKCGCSFPDKWYEDRPCEGNCYPPMMPKGYWKEYKKFLNEQRAD